MNRIQANQAKALFDTSLICFKAIATSAGIPSNQVSMPVLTTPLQASVLDFAYALELCSDDAAAVQTIKQYAPFVPTFLFLAPLAGDWLAKTISTYEDEQNRAARPYFLLSTFVASYIKNS